MRCPKTVSQLRGSLNALFCMNAPASVSCVPLLSADRLSTSRSIVASACASPRLSPSDANRRSAPAGISAAALARRNSRVAPAPGSGGKAVESSPELGRGACSVVVACCGLKVGKEWASVLSKGEEDAEDVASSWTSGVLKEAEEAGSKELREKCAESREVKRVCGQDDGQKVARCLYTHSISASTRRAASRLERTRICAMPTDLLHWAKARTKSCFADFKMGLLC